MLLLVSMAAGGGGGRSDQTNEIEHAVLGRGGGKKKASDNAAKLPKFELHEYQWCGWGRGFLMNIKAGR